MGKLGELDRGGYYSKIRLFQSQANLRAMGLAGAAIAGGKGVLPFCVSTRHRPGRHQTECHPQKPFQHHRKNKHRSRTSPTTIISTNSAPTKAIPSKNAQKFRTSPWTVSVEGEVKNKTKYSMDDILKLAPLEERIYRHRCVEGWSIVVPWIGYSLSTILKLAEPTEKAKFVAFESYYDPGQMPWAASSGIELPYVEGLRLDEAMNPLTLLCVGMYGESLPNQDGAPVRLVIPWKYGFKSIKSIVKIRCVKSMPSTTWNIYAPNEYGFYSNVNPNVDHPALEPGHRTSPGRIPQAQDADVQRLRRSGRQLVHRHGSEEELLTCAIPYVSSS